MNADLVKSHLAARVPADVLIRELATILPALGAEEERDLKSPLIGEMAARQDALILLLSRTRPTTAEDALAMAAVGFERLQLNMAMRPLDEDQLEQAERLIEVSLPLLAKLLPKRSKAVQGVINHYAPKEVLTEIPQ
ncbi:MAG TPA: hypothetical protein PKA13_21580 [Geminicoccaceae bacterium]|nr:hypothetical protein [Geminicoccus sp.]HMU52386.1 hypothetical protein [Geminicoccaceae bacterium]